MYAWWRCHWCRPCRLGPTTFLESQKIKYPKNAIQNEGRGVGTHKSWHKSSKLFQIPSQWTIYHHCFHIFCNFKSRHNAQFTILGFIFSAVLNRFKSRHNACLNYIAFIYFSAVSTRLKYHQNACFRDNV